MPHQGASRPPGGACLLQVGSLHLEVPENSLFVVTSPCPPVPITFRMHRALHITRTFPRVGCLDSRQETGSLWPLSCLSAWGAGSPPRRGPTLRPKVFPKLLWGSEVAGKVLDVSGRGSVAGETAGEWVLWYAEARPGREGRKLTHLADGNGSTLLGGGARWCPEIVIWLQQCGLSTVTALLQFPEVSWQTPCSFSSCLLCYFLGVM